MRDDYGLFVNLFDDDGTFYVLGMSNWELLVVNTMGVRVALVVDVIVTVDVTF